MSRSRKKTPIHGNTTSASEKADKKAWHSRMRARERDRLINDPESEPTHEHEVSDTWAMRKDGRHYAPGHPKLMRK